jgi:hypothetical protein
VQYARIRHLSLEKKKGRATLYEMAEIVQSIGAACLSVCDAISTAKPLLMLRKHHYPLTKSF